MKLDHADHLMGTMSGKRDFEATSFLPTLECLYIFDCCRYRFFEVLKIFRMAMFQGVIVK